MGQGSEAAHESFSQHPRYVEMCVRVMEAAVQQGLASSIPAWSQAVLQNIRATCKMPRAELTRFLAGLLLSYLHYVCLLCTVCCSQSAAVLCDFIVACVPILQEQLIVYGNIIGIYSWHTAAEDLDTLPRVSSTNCDIICPCSVFSVYIDSGGSWMRQLLS